MAVGRNGIQSSAVLVVELETWNTGSEVEPRSVLAGTRLTKFPRNGVLGNFEPAQLK